MVLNILGLLSPCTYAEVLQQLKEKALKRAGITEEVLRSIEERNLARNNKEFARSDQIRKDMAAKGIALVDVGNYETVWRPHTPEPVPETASYVKEPNELPAASS